VSNLDSQIFDEFIQSVIDKKIFSDVRIDELKSFINKQNVSAQDWDLLVDKECFPKESKNNAE